MRPKEVMWAKTEVEGSRPVIMLGGVKDDDLVVLGATMQTSVEIGMLVNSLVIVPEKGKLGLIALTVVSSRFEKKNYTKHHFFLKVDYTGDEPKVDLEHPWIPPADKLAQIYRKSFKIDNGSGGYGWPELTCIETTIDGHRFISVKRAAWEDASYVDGNLLCLYLIGKISPVEILAKAREFEEEEALEDQVARLEKENKEIRAAAEAGAEAIKEAEEECLALQGEHSEELDAEKRKTQLAIKVSSSLSSQLKDWKDIAHLLRGVLKSKWFLRKKDKEYIRQVVDINKKHETAEPAATDDENGQCPLCGRQDPAGDKKDLDFIFE
ncbi:hypothetical protein ACFL2U_01010 [Patescibacteria group bacterium]